MPVDDPTPLPVMAPRDGGRETAHAVLPLARAPPWPAPRSAWCQALQEGRAVHPQAALTSSLAESPTITSSLGATPHFSAMCSSDAGLGCGQGGAGAGSG